MIKEAIKKVLQKTDLGSREMASVFDEIMSGAAKEEDVKEFLLSLKDKGESPEEIAAAAKIMREKCTKVSVSTENLIDTCGTGGAKTQRCNDSDQRSANNDLLPFQSTSRRGEAFQPWSWLASTPGILPIQNRMPRPSRSARRRTSGIHSVARSRLSRAASRLAGLCALSMREAQAPR